MHPPSDRAKKKMDRSPRRGGSAARADLPTPQEPPRIASADPIRKSLYPSRKNRASRARRAASEHAGQAQGVAAAPDLSAGKKWSSQRVSNRGNLPPRLCVEFVGPWKFWAEIPRNEKWSGRRDLNPRLSAPKADALPDCATPRRALDWSHCAWPAAKNNPGPRVCQEKTSENSEVSIFSGGVDGT